MSAPATELTVRKAVTVACTVEHAFQMFTAGISSWWPLATHSVGAERARTAVFEGRVGGRIYEVWDDGSEYDWGIVTAWEPPRRVVYSWSPNPEQTVSTEVEVRFAPQGDGTLVELEHRGWERLGEKVADLYASYDTGWDVVLGTYRHRVELM
jgi:uncharacterized protein YndB with AHSA1/START domain